MEGGERMGFWIVTGTLCMRRIENGITGLLRLAILLTAIASAGCSVLAPEPEIASIPEPVEPESEPEIVVLPPLPAPEPRTAPLVVAPPALPALAIVLTSGIAAYADVAEELSRRFENHVVYNLAEDARAPVNILHLINDSDSQVVVAIGMRAAMSAVAQSRAPVVFSQVFNYQRLLTENSRGVSAVAPLDAQIAAWKELDPSILRIGAIVGSGHDSLIADAKLAAEKHGVELLLQVADSDQETLFIFNRMIRNIDGFWLFADNRVLSPRALQKMMSAAKQQQVPVLVPSESMLALGADVSIASVASDIAEIVTQIIRKIEAGDLQDVPAMSPLSEIRVTTNDSTRVADR